MQVLLIFSFVFACGGIEAVFDLMDKASRWTSLLGITNQNNYCTMITGHLRPWKKEKAFFFFFNVVNICMSNSINIICDDYPNRYFMPPKMK